MAAVAGKDTEPELMLRRALWARGHRYRLHAKDLVGTPDLVFRQLRVALFVDGDFWHGRLIQEGKAEQFSRQFRRRRRWWLEKVQGNIERDSLVRRALESDGWLVIRVWESDIRTDVRRVVEAVERALNARSSHGR